jgi:hypothetical protein
VMAVAGVGAALTAAGARMRRALRRSEPPA